ncbi:choline/carnitine O-acyltransferase [Auritidibacter sp. NML100628]|uniref:choline/carnitine O-acyltransferase n=1 Tax=Auritidibacter sp. NML100628 TaxID=2170742 RepID=UPI000D739D09|nr:choline/carnitine O-acyltransferase [Auritidibacter sp. NML100628]PXA76669.1 hypothetical protein DCC24_06410 [Auritidibacter sp. NML100628]
MTIEVTHPVEEKAHTAVTLTPHPATVDLKPLPLPHLDDTLDTLRHALRALLAGEEFAHAEKIIDSFRTRNGPILQSQLEQLASRAEATGTNWMSDYWYSSYLAVREPLMLASNVAFQIEIPSEKTGSARVADLVHRLLRFHLIQARGEMPEEIDARGSRITMNQWFTFNGGIRTPQVDEDVIEPCSLDAREREIGVFYRGQLHAVTVTDQTGALVTPTQLRVAIDQILDEAHTAPQAQQAQQPNFADISALGSSFLAEHLPALRAVGDNEHTYQRLKNLLFTVDITDDDLPQATELRNVTFRAGAAWVYKPISYQVGLHHDWLCMEVEHTAVDGATLVTALERIQHLDREPTTTDPHQPELAYEPLTWEFTDEFLATFTPEVEEYHEQASHYQVEIIEVDRLLPVENYPMKLSRDACAQLMMSTAQYLTFQHVRAVYEAVDMREFRAGRTECLRAATPEAVRFATALAQGDATENLLIDALNAHRIWVKKCKAGAGMDRHLQLLEATAIADNTLMASDPFFTDPAIRSVRRDFLSTTSVGGPEQIIRYAFAPTIPEGFGISYTPNPAHGEFCVSWHDQTTEDPETFLANLRRAGEMFWEFVDSLPRPEQN